MWASSFPVMGDYFKTLRLSLFVCNVIGLTCRTFESGKESRQGAPAGIVQKRDYREEGLV